MEVKTYRAGTMQEALELVRNDLGPDATVLRTREVPNGLLQWIAGGKSVEVTATREMSAPRRIAPRERALDATSIRLQLLTGLDLTEIDELRPNKPIGMTRGFRHGVSTEQKYSGSKRSLPAGLFHVFSQLLEAEFDQEMAYGLVEQLRRETAGAEGAQPDFLMSRLAKMVENELRTTGPIDVSPGTRKIVALVGPTGVGKTTTIAKLAAQLRLKESRRVGLLTVDTFRVSAVEQLQTYADIIDLPMEVVATPGEMKQALARLGGLDVVLIDTAGRSPHDELKLRELKSLLGAAAPDEVHLVLSGSSSVECLTKSVEQFSAVGVTALLLTKIDEATGLGHVLKLVRECRKPLSYTTHGQNVPDDIAVADRLQLARQMLGMNA